MKRLGIVGFLTVTQPKVPLTDTGSVIAPLTEHGRHSQSAWFNQARRISLQHALLQTRAPAVPASENAVARGCADRRRRMHVREADALPGETIGIRCGHGRIGVVAVEITPAQVVGE